MKTILVDAINGLILEDGTLFQAMYDMFEGYPNRKIVLTGANDEQFKNYHLDECPYEIFTLKHNPEKAEPEYFRTLLSTYDLTPKDVVYFEHSPGAVKSAQSLGITTYFYDHTIQDLVALKVFIDANIA